MDRHRPAPPGRARAPHLIYTSDDTGDLTITYFGLPKNYLEKLYPVGAVRYVSGTVALYDGMLQMVHPDRVVDEAGFAEAATGAADLSAHRRAEPGASQEVGGCGGLAGAATAGMARWTWLRQQEWPPFADAVGRLHHPSEPTDVQPDAKAWSRLAYDELLASQLALSLVRAHMRRPAGQRITGDGRLRNKVIAALPYRLTSSQLQAIDDITADLGKPQRMLRLLQGDVGSGKTVVALLAAAAVIEAGGQAALMAPTELLARQHYATIAPLAAEAGIGVAILTGRERGPERREVLRRLAAGQIHLVVGTHALFQEEVVFQQLALAIVDEQHRFGVHQRLALAQKGEAVDVLVLTATPIPRTLVLSYFGDMDVSQMPRSRQAGS